MKNCPGIFTFPRGGLIFGVLLSYKTNLPLLANPVDNCIVIDDIIDTGITMKKYSDLKNDKNYFITTMYIVDTQFDRKAKYQCDEDFCMFVKHEGDWVIFPWEDDKVQ